MLSIIAGAVFTAAMLAALFWAFGWWGLGGYGLVSLLGPALIAFLMSNPSTDSRLLEAFKAFCLWVPWLGREVFKAIFN